MSRIRNLILELSGSLMKKFRDEKESKDFDDSEFGSAPSVEEAFGSLEGIKKDNIRNRNDRTDRYI